MFYEVFFSWGCSVSLQIYYTAMYRILLSCWACIPSCYLKLLDKLQKRICRAVGPSLAASLEPLGHRRNAASLTLSVPIPDEEKELTLNFIFTLLCGASKGFMKALKAFIKPFKVAQRSVKVKIQVNFYFTTTF